MPLAGFVNVVDRRLLDGRLSIDFVNAKRTVGIGTESDSIAVPPWCHHGHGVASGCAAGVPVMKTAEAR